MADTLTYVAGSTSSTASFPIPVSGETSSVDAGIIQHNKIVTGGVGTDGGPVSVSNPLPVQVSDGTNALGTTAHPVQIALPAATVTTLTPLTAVTANAGTNLNTSLLALESGGNLATLAETVTSAHVATKNVASNTTPTFTDDITILAAQVLTRGTVVAATFDTRPGQTNACQYWYPMFRFGRGGTAAISTPIVFGVYKMWNAVNFHPANISPGNNSSVTAAASTTTSGTNTAGSNTLNVASNTGFNVGDTVCIWDAGNTTFARLEWNIVAGLISTTGLYLRNPIQFTHTSSADTVRNLSDTFVPPQIPGGFVYTVIADYYAQTTGDNGVLQILAQLQLGSTTL